MHTFTVSVYGVDTSAGIMCVKCTFAPCLQMDDASIWSSGKWEPVQRAETYAETECQVPFSVCLPSPFLHGVAMLL